MNDYILIDLFSGIGGFPKGFMDAGINIINNRRHSVNSYETNICPALAAKDFKEILTAKIKNKDKTIYRRLTEIEYERFQGFPDNWTQHGLFDDKLKKISKSRRYEMLGNSVTVPIVKLIAQRLFNINQTHNS